jgi:hypothetical protein
MAEIVAESLADSRSVAGRKATESPPVSLRRLRLFTVHSFDGRSRASKRARAIAAELVRALGGNVTTLQQQAVERAAVFTAIAEDGCPRACDGAGGAALHKGAGSKNAPGAAAPMGWNMDRSRQRAKK